MAGEQATARNHRSSRPMSPGGKYRRRHADHSADSRMPVLAQVYRLDIRTLDVDIR